MSQHPFVTRIFFLVPVPLLEGDDEVMIKPTNRDTSHSEMERTYISQHLQKSNSWNKMGLIVLLVTCFCVTKCCPVKLCHSFLRCPWRGWPPSVSLQVNSPTSHTVA